MILDKWLVRVLIGLLITLVVIAGIAEYRWRKYDGIEGRHIDAKADFREAETVYVRGRDRVITLTETLNVTDTVQVREYVRACTSALNACDTALAKARTAIATGDSALKAAKRNPFLEGYGAVLYDPVAQNPTVRLGLQVKPRSRISPTIEGEQRFEVGASPRLNVGVRIRF